MTYYYSPHTGERIVTNDPADWMGSTDIAPPAFETATAGCFWRGASWEIVASRPPAEPVPATITMRQARLALLGAGLLSEVDAAINSLPEPDRSAAKIEWEYAAVVQRDSGLLPAIGSALGMTEAQIDDLFVSAAKL